MTGFTTQQISCIMATMCPINVDRPYESSRPDYPRPQLVRAAWAGLDGKWDFAFGPEDGRPLSTVLPAISFDRTIEVPFPPESAASGIAERGFQSVAYYRRTIAPRDLLAAGFDNDHTRLVLHFGAVDYRADVWLDGRYLGHHEGGSTPFSFDVSEVLGPDTESVLVVRAEDDPHDVEQPRGKQDWRLEPHGIWYHRTTGIWQPVWLEAAPEIYVTDLAWISDVPAGTVVMELELNVRPSTPVTVTVSLRFEGAVLATVGFAQGEPRSKTTISLPRQANGQEYESLLWSPDSPRLLDALVTVESNGGVPDVVSSYLGLRSVAWRDGHFLLNDRPCYLRAVLEQGYWPDTHLAAPNGDALRAEVQLIKDLGFNTVRVHQKVEDPRFLYWADRLGLLVWGENASAYQFSVTAVERMTREWVAIIRRDRSHPSIITWVPLNESWGVQHIAHDSAQLSYARALFHLTKTLDPTRLVVGNDGWEIAESDIWAIHDYGTTRDDLEANYADRASVDELLDGTGPLGRTIGLSRRDGDTRHPVMVTEFGGIGFAPAGGADSWGYETVNDTEEYAFLLRELFEGIQSSPILAGFCYTQFTDTLQEVNGLLDSQRRPKLALDRIRSIVLGDGVQTSAHRRPKGPIEKPVQRLSSLRPGVLAPSRAATDEVIVAATPKD